MKRYSILLMLLFLFFTTVIHAQVGPPDAGGAPPPDAPGSGPNGGNVNDVSITAFLWLLGFAGVLLGFKSSKRK